MAETFKSNKQAVEKALKSLKEKGLVSKNAVFSYEAEDDLRGEVSYRDIDFLRCLAETSESEVVDSALEFLKNHKFIDEGANYDKELFSSLKDEVKNKFEIPSTAMTPVMERLLFMLSSVKKPRRLIAIGIYCGYTFVWSAGPYILKEGPFEPEQIVGIDIDYNSLNLAEKNLSIFPGAGKVELVAEDALITIDRLEGQFDFVYLDADNAEIGKGLYLELLKKLYPKLQKGAWVLAHDVTFYYFTEQLKEYLEFVRDKDHFAESICFDVDPYGLELSVR